MIMSLITIAVLLGTIFGLTLARYRRRPEDDKRTYGSWLGAKARALFAAGPWKTARKVLAEWIAAHYPSWTKWILIALLASFLYQALAGIFFEVFVARGLFGLPLIGHMIGGGLFAASLAALLLARGRAYRLDEDEPVLFDSGLRPVPRAAAGAFTTKIVFWVFAAFGLVQTATAVGSMLPVFTFATQETLLTIHRLSALGLAVMAAIFADRVFIPRYRP
jgi:hypothetical protein